MEERKCSQCQISKPLDMFHNDSRRKDKKQSTCKKCRFLLNEARQLKDQGVAQEEIKEIMEILPTIKNCMLCRKDDFLHIDISPESKTLRGFLCKNCKNIADTLSSNQAILKRFNNYIHHQST